MMPVKADLFICSFLIDNATVLLSCQAIIWISVFVGLFRVFANPVTYVKIFPLKSCSATW